MSEVTRTGDLWKERNKKGGDCPRWRGHLFEAGRRRKVTLFRDAESSKRRLGELQRDADQRAAGIVTADTERLNRPVAELASAYVEALRVRKKNVDHVRISEWMLNRLIEVCGWKGWRDITCRSVEAALPVLGETPSYQNKFIVRAKAFVRWLLPDGQVSPLSKLARVNEKGGKRTRERRAATDAELAALLAVSLPADRRLAYVLAAFNGLRRNEAARLVGEDVKREAGVAFLGVRRKQGQDDSQDFVPLHGYVLELLAGRSLVAGAKVLASVPDIKTMKRDLARAGVAFVDGRGRRLDYHSLRHTFLTNLDRWGCSRATKKRLMRHANEDVTDGYAQAELREMAAALAELPWPGSAGRSGTNTGQNVGFVGHCVSLQDVVSGADLALVSCPQVLQGAAVVAGGHGVARADLPDLGSGDIVVKSGPSTQVD